MSTTTEVIAHHWAFSVFIILALGLCGLMLFGAYTLGGRAKGREKNIPYESGINSVGSARLRLSAKFYLVAMFFVIFDVEALYLYAWSVSLRESGWVGFIEAGIFIVVLLVGLVYLARIGALDWTPLRSKCRIQHESALVTPPRPGRSPGLTTGAPNEAPCTSVVP